MQVPALSCVYREGDVSDGACFVISRGVVTLRRSAAMSALSGVSSASAVRPRAAGQHAGGEHSDPEEGTDAESLERQLFCGDPFVRSSSQLMAWHTRRELLTMPS